MTITPGAVTHATAVRRATLHVGVPGPSSRSRSRERRCDSGPAVDAEFDPDVGIGAKMYGRPMPGDELPRSPAAQPRHTRKARVLAEFRTRRRAWRWRRVRG